MRVLNGKDFTSFDKAKKILLLGEPATGKSFFASTVPTPALVLSFDGDGSEYAGKDIDILEFKLNETKESMKSREYISWLALKKTIEELRQGTFNKGKEYKSIIIDSVTNLEVAGLNYIASTTPESKKGASGMNLAMYGDLVVQMGFLLRALYDFKQNILLIGHIKLDEEVVTGRDKARLSVYGRKLPGEIASLFPIVVFSDVIQEGTKSKYVLRVKPAGALLPRFRIANLDINKLPNTISNTWENLFDNLKKASE